MINLLAFNPIITNGNTSQTIQLRRLSLVSIAITLHLLSGGVILQFYYFFSSYLALRQWLLELRASVLHAKHFKMCDLWPDNISEIFCHTFLDEVTRYLSDRIYKSSNSRRRLTILKLFILFVCNLLDGYPWIYSSHRD